MLAACLLAWLGNTTPSRGLDLLPSRVPAIELDVAGDWINSAPLRLRDLRGKFVVLDFWTYCCINCMHILPELKRLEHAYPQELVVIGVHSAKFATEHDAQNVREAVVRYDIEHPVLNDAELVLWRKYGVDVWPSLIVIDPEGKVIATHRGEITFDVLDRLLSRQIAAAKKNGTLVPKPLLLQPERERQPDGPLRFPGKVLPDEAGRRLFISDSGHHRIVVLAPDSTVLDVIGSGTAGSKDGSFADAQFDHPQGLAVKGDVLFVADTENHLIRRVDLASRRVRTIAGNGKQARQALVRNAVAPTSCPLSSPWDLWLHGDYLFIAMAGSHQIWRMHSDGSQLAPFAGNGIEDIVDGPHLPRSGGQTGFASFAQPSGLASDGRRLFVADSEGSSIRSVPLDGKDRVTTLLGTAKLSDGRLFTFGDQDGGIDQALLQHPVCVSYDQGALYVADTYNNKIRRIDLGRQAVTTVAGDRQPGRTDDPPRFNEPTGIRVGWGKLFVADTNNHLIRILDPTRNFAVRTLTIHGLQPPGAARPAAAVPDDTQRLTFAPATVRPVGGRLQVAVELPAPAGFKLSEQAPASYLVQVARDAQLVQADAVDAWQRVARPTRPLGITIPVVAEQGAERLRITFRYYVCRTGDEGVCKPVATSWTGQCTLAPNATESVLRLRAE